MRPARRSIRRSGRPSARPRPISRPSTAPNFRGKSGWRPRPGSSASRNRCPSPGWACTFPEAALPSFPPSSCWPSRPHWPAAGNESSAPPAGKTAPSPQKYFTQPGNAGLPGSSASAEPRPSRPWPSGRRPCPRWTRSSAPAIPMSPSPSSWLAAAIPPSTCPPVRRK